MPPRIDQENGEAAQAMFLITLLSYMHSGRYLTPLHRNGSYYFNKPHSLEQI